MTKRKSSTIVSNVLESSGKISRRNAIKTMGGVGLGTLAGSLFTTSIHAAAKPFKIGFVSPQTGPLAVFAEADDWALEDIRKAVSGGISVNGKIHPVEIIVKDSQSSSNRAAEVASQLILDDEVDIIVATSTPATTNPVADQAELNGVPCVTNDTPWQPHFFGRGGDPKQGFEWTYHFFWGLEDVMGSFTNMWSMIDTNKTVGALWPNDSDGNAWGDAERGFPPILKEKGFKLVDLGRYQSPSDDFSSYIFDFKKKDVEIVSGVVPPPDFANFWSQSGQQGFKPKIVTVAKASEFYSAVKAFGDRAEGLSVEMSWSPVFPYGSGLTGMTAAEYAKAYTAETGRPWSVFLGFKHSLFEVAIDALKRSDGPGQLESIRDAIRDTNYASITGPINFKTGPVPNVCKTPLVSGQWNRKGSSFELEVVENSLAPNIPQQAQLKPIG